MGAGAAVWNHWLCHLDVLYPYMPWSRSADPSQHGMLIRVDLMLGRRRRRRSSIKPTRMKRSVCTRYRPMLHNNNWKRESLVWLLGARRMIVYQTGRHTLCKSNIYLFATLHLQLAQFSLYAYESKMNEQKMLSQCWVYADPPSTTGRKHNILFLWSLNAKRGTRTPNSAVVGGSVNHKRQTILIIITIIENFIYKG